MMDALDGNSIGGALLAHFGVEMTTASGACAHCGAVAQIAELRVYRCAPAAVARCRSCSRVVLVIVEDAERREVYLDGFRLM